MYISIRRVRRKLHYIKLTAFICQKKERKKTDGLVGSGCLVIELLGHFGNQHVSMV